MKRHAATVGTHARRPPKPAAVARSVIRCGSGEASGLAAALPPQTIVATRHSSPTPAAETSSQKALKACGPDRRACKRLPMK